jgi:Animal haem peroxidase
VHDWFSHGKNESENPWLVPLEAGDPWPEQPMPIPRTRRDPSATADGPPTFVTDDTHWWDGSQVYGRDPAFASALRTGEHGKLKLDAQGLIPQEIEAHVDLTGVAGNFWVGLALLHSLFMREHNAVCDHLHSTHSELSDDELYDKARLVVAALMAKIHTVDWTPAIIAHPTTVTALRTNWWGLEGRRLDRLIGRRTSNEVIRGIPGSPTDLHGVPFQLTEEFVAVYRMHPLIPDEYSFRSLADDQTLQNRTLPEVSVQHVRDRLTEMSMADVLYSFGTMHPGAITLHNFPRFLQHFDRADGSLVDLASIDVLRVRERGVPRYNEFRRLLHLQAYDTFEEMADTPEHAADLRRVYSDPEEVDTMIGMYAEKKPKGFGFSDTAFRIFILMASRRLESDRFFTSDYRPEIYTKEGIDWVEDNSMKTLLLRHFPELEPALRGVDNPFAPWPRATA